MIAAIAMLIGRPYEQILSAAQAIQPDYNPDTDPLAPAVMRRVAYAAGALLVSSICMDWRYPGIIGVLSKTLPGCGHAVFWDGAQLIDPGGQAIYDMEYVQSEAVEYIQRAADIQALVEHDRNLRVS